MKATKLSTIIGFLERFAPLGLAEDWDNVGLLLGDRNAMITSGITCLTVTPEVVDEAVESGANLIVSHHPMPFQALKKITSDTVTGRMILKLCCHSIAVYSPHTAFDSTSSGINQMIAERVGLEQIQPLKMIDGWDQHSANEDTSSEPVDTAVYGVGRQGTLPDSMTCQQLGDHLSKTFQIESIKLCGSLEKSVKRIGVACGSAGQFLSDAARLGCDAFVTGETNFHTCLDAHARDVSLFLLGHYGSERFAVEQLASHLSGEFSELPFSPSSRERDPIQYI